MNLFEVQGARFNLEDVLLDFESVRLIWKSVQIDVKIV